VSAASGRGCTRFTAVHDIPVAGTRFSCRALHSFGGGTRWQRGSIRGKWTLSFLGASLSAPHIRPTVCSAWRRVRKRKGGVKMSQVGCNAGGEGRGGGGERQGGVDCHAWRRGCLVERKEGGTPLAVTRRCSFTRCLRRHSTSLSHVNVPSRSFVRTMNWTGGSLRRTKKANSATLQRQKAYFAEARTNLQNARQTLAAPFRPSYLRGKDSTVFLAGPSPGAASVRGGGHAEECGEEASRQERSPDNKWCTIGGREASPHQSSSRRVARHLVQSEVSHKAQQGSCGERIYGRLPV